MIKNLDTVTLVAVSSIRIKDTINALKQCMKYFNFKEVLFISDTKPFFLGNGITYRCCKKLSSSNQYSSFILYDLVDYIRTEHVLIIQYDGFILNPDKWTDDFLKYDYIGAPWPNNFVTYSGDIQQVGNGGFSLRSRKLLEVARKEKIPFISRTGRSVNEDLMIALEYPDIYKKNGCIIAPFKVALSFSQEMNLPEFDDITPLGFHAFYPKKWLSKKQIKLLEKIQFTKKERIHKYYKNLKKKIKKKILSFILLKK